MLGEINRYLAVERQEPDTKKRAAEWAAAQKKIAGRMQKELGIAL